jgi:hypothetical protein
MQSSPKVTQIGILDLRIYHLATLLTNAKSKIFAENFDETKTRHLKGFRNRGPYSVTFCSLLHTCPDALKYYVLYIRVYP